MNNPHEIKTVKCAYCGAVRQEANHWFVIAVARGSFRCAPLPANPTVGFSRRPGSVRGLRRTEQPVCGQQCAQKTFERYLAQGSSGRVAL